jgi:hypothetical protein
VPARGLPRPRGPPTGRHRRTRSSRTAFRIDRQDAHLRTARIPSASDNLRPGSPSLPARPPVVAFQAASSPARSCAGFPCWLRHARGRRVTRTTALQYMRRDVPIAGRPQPSRDRGNRTITCTQRFPQRTVNPGGGNDADIPIWHGHQCPSRRLTGSLINPEPAVQTFSLPLPRNSTRSTKPGA